MNKFIYLKIFFTFIFIITIINKLMLLFWFDYLKYDTIWVVRIFSRDFSILINSFFILCEVYFIAILWFFKKHFKKIGYKFGILYLGMGVVFTLLLAIRFDNVKCATGFSTDNPAIVVAERLFLTVLFYFTYKISLNEARQNEIKRQAQFDVSEVLKP